MTYNTSAAPRKPSEATTRSTDNWRLWWRQQSLIDGTDWPTLLGAAEQVLRHLRALHVMEASS